MSQPHRPKKGSRAYNPKCRARSYIGHIKSWSADREDLSPKLQGFAGYKCGMTHLFMHDYRPTSTTSGQEVYSPATVIETPPIMIKAIKLYMMTPYGLKGICKGSKAGVDEVRVIGEVQPKLVKSIPSKRSREIEIRVGNSDITKRIAYANSIIGKEISVNEYTKEGEMLDVIGVTEGKGFQGQVKRFGVKKLSHKNSKHRRMIGTAGNFSPSYIRPQVPQAGQLGYQQRTEYNKRVLKIGDDVDTINPRAGFLNYGIVNNKYMILHGTIPGPAKRLVRIRDSIRYLAGVKVEKPDISYISRG